MTIVARTLADRVFEIVRERVVSGDLPGNSAIRQDALAAELGVSKIPLREALARLEQEGLLSSQANRGYSVRPMSAGQADEIYALRLSIEPAAAAHGAEMADANGQGELLDAFRALEEAAAANLSDVGVRSRDFHIAMVRPSGRHLTTQLVERLGILSERYVVAHVNAARSGARRHDGRQGLVDAWLARDGGKVQTLLHDHIEGTLTDLRAGFSATQG